MHAYKNTFDGGVCEIFQNSPEPRLIGLNMGGGVYGTKHFKFATGSKNRGDRSWDANCFRDIVAAAIVLPKLPPLKSCTFPNVVTLTERPLGRVFSLFVLKFCKLFSSNLNLHNPLLMVFRYHICYYKKLHATSVRW